jgi:hypothetical protein
VVNNGIFLVQKEYVSEFVEGVAVGITSPFPAGFNKTVEI